MIENNSLKCAPGVNFSEGSCFSLEQLKRIGNKFNKRYGNIIKSLQKKNY